MSPARKFAPAFRAVIATIVVEQDERGAYHVIASSPGGERFVSGTCPTFLGALDGMGRRLLARAKSQDCDAHGRPLPNEKEPMP